MALVKFKPTSPGRRFGNAANFSEVTKDTPHKPLTEALRKKGGRNSHGHMTARRRGQGHRRRYRLIDFRRNRIGEAAKVLSVEYDPNRTARIALLEYQDGVKSYIVSPDGLKVGQTVVSGSEADVQVGNHLPLRNIPVI